MNSRWIFDEDNFIQRELEGEFIVLNLKTENYYTLDTTGSFIFGLLLEGKTTFEIEDAVSGKYKTVDQKIIQKDTRNFIQQLQTKKMIYAAR